MPVPYLASATGNPTELHSAIVGQATRGVPPIATATWRDIRDYGGGPQIAQSRIAPQAFSPDGEPLTPLTGKLTIAAGQKSLGDLDPNDYALLHMFSNYFGSASGGRHTISNPGAGAIYQWKFSKGDTTQAATAYLANMLFSNVLPGQVVFDMLTGGWVISAQPNANLQIQFNLGAGYMNLADDGEIDTAVGTPTIPLVRGFWGQEMTEADDGDLWVKVVTDDGGGAFTFQAALGSSTVEPTWSSSQTGTLGTWVKCLDSVTSLWIGGSLGTAVEIYLPVGATLEDGSIFRIPANRPNWTNTLGASRAISSVDSIYILDGEQIRLTGGVEINSAWSTFEVSPGVSNIQGHLVDRRGNQVTTVTPSRRIEDLTLQSAILTRGSVPFVMKGETETVIGGETEPYQVVVVIPSLTIAGDIYNPAVGAETAEESPVLTAGVPATTYTYTDERGNAFATDKAVAVFLRNARATL